MTKKPFEENVANKFGAPMGRPSDKVLSGKVHLQKVPMHDMCYDKGGAYWGMGIQLWCAWNDKGVMYFRAPVRALAKMKAELKDCTFYR